MARKIKDMLEKGVAKGDQRTFYAFIDGGLTTKDRHNLIERRKYDFDIGVKIDGELRTFTLEEFKKRLFTN